MKFQCNRVLSAAIVGASILFAVTSCKKSSTGSAAMSATINGGAWASSFPVAGGHTSQGDTYELGAAQYKNSDSTILAVGFNGPVVLNQAFSSDTTTLDIAYQDIKAQVQYDGVSGHGFSILTVTSLDSVNHKIAGTFSGVLYNDFGGGDSVVVTNGRFSAPYLAQ